MYKIYTKEYGTPKQCLHQLLLIMRLTLVILLITLMQVSASVKAQKITLSAKNTSLARVFKAISQQSNYDFLVKSSMLKAVAPVTIDVRNADLFEVLTSIFKDRPLAFSMEDKTITVTEKDQSILGKIRSLIAGQILISGRLSDTTGAPLANATVINQTSKVSMVTSITGEFKINANIGDVIYISYVGHNPYVFTVKDQMPFQDIVLRDASTRLQEVVVQTGFQTISKERVTGSIAKPDMGVFADRTGTMNVLYRLEGQIPGLTILPGPRVLTSRNGSTTGQQSIVRGVSSIYLNPDPLYVVNGLPVTDISTLNPDDIADITVLKDAAAAAIWGSRAANGVIVITTKTGKKNTKLKVTYTGFYNYQGKPDLNYKPVLNSVQYIQAAQQTFDPVTYPWNTLTTSFLAPHEVILYNQYRGLITKGQADAGLAALASTNNVQQIKDLLYRNASIANHTISLSGGGDAYAFYGSASYNDNQSNKPGESNNAYRITLNQNFTPAKRIKISLNTLLSNTLTSAGRAVTVDNTFIPYQLFRDVSGNNLNMNYVQGFQDSTRNAYQQRSKINLDYNPLNEQNYGYTKTNDININVSSNVDVNLYQGLSFRGSYGYISDRLNNTVYDDAQSYAQRKQLLSFTVAPTIGSTPVYYLPTTGGTYTTGDITLRNWTIRNQLIYDYSDKSGNNVFGLQGGQDIQEQSSITNSTTVKGYNTDLQTYTVLDYATLNRPVANTVTANGGLNQNSYLRQETLQRYVSYFALANYTLNHKYSIDGSCRVDHSSLFGTDITVQNKPVWSIGGKWALGREDFMKNVTWVQDLALRATYGRTGNSPYSNAASIYDILIASGTGTIAGNSLSISSPANTRLVWELTQTKNFGVDFSVLNRRITASIDLYLKNTQDLLGGVNLDPLGGYTGLTGNIGNMHNRGVELSLKTVNIQLPNFSWTTNLTGAYNENKLESYTALSAFANTAGTKVSSTYLIGYSMQSLFAYKFAGLDNLGDPQIQLADGTITKTPNIAKPADIVYMGTTIPKFNGGFSNTFRYKTLSLTANMVYSFGAVMRRDVDNFYSGRFTGVAGTFGGNINAEFADRWQNPGDQAFTNVPSYVSSSALNARRSINYYIQSDINVISASYIKLRDITLSWTLPARPLKVAGIEHMRIFLQTTNFMVWKNNKYGIDPEYQDATNGLRRTPDFTHSISVGTNLTF